MINRLLDYLPLLIPIIIIPLIMRLIIAPLILLRLKTKYVKDLTSTIKDGWVDDRDLEAIEYLKKHAWKGLNSPFVISYNFNFLTTQVKTLFADITKIYNNNSKSQINLQFSIQKILETFYLIFEDLHKDLKLMKIYRFLEKLPISTFLRITKLNRSIKVITHNRVIKLLQKYRVTTKVLRFIFVPILGVPIILSQLIFSLLYTTLFEGYLRFIYGLILIKVGYYTIYLYSDRNSSLHNRIKFSKDDIIKRGNIIEDRHTHFKNRYYFSSHLNSVMEIFKAQLEKEGIVSSREASSENDTLERLFKRISNTVKNTIESELNYETTNKFNLKPLINISKIIGQEYFPECEQPLFNLRVKEFIELGYFLTTLSLKNIYTIPASRRFLDKIPLKFVIDISDFIEDRNIKKYIPHIKKGGRVVKNIQSYYWASRLILKRSHPIVFAASMVTPLLFQQVQDSLKEYVYNMSCLLLIDSYESTTLKDDKCRINSLFD